jgi:hypothetical protein
MADYSGTTGYQDIYNQILQRGAGAGWNPQKTKQKLGGMADQFSGMFRNMTGRDPTPDEMSSMFTNIGGSVMESPAGYSGTSYADFQNLFNPYIQNQYGPQIQQYQTGQQQAALGQRQTDVQNLVNQMNQQTQDYLTNPLTQEQMKQQLNSSGMLDSGAYSQMLAQMMAQGATQNQASALQGVTIPAEQNILQTEFAPYQQSLSQMYPGLSSYGQGQSDIYNFGLQSDLARALADSGQSSQLQNIMGMFSGGAQGAGSLMSGYGQMKQGKSAVCVELYQRGLISEEQIYQLLSHVFPGLFMKGRAFWLYMKNNRKLVAAANKAGVDWSYFKPLFIDRVMSEKNRVKAVDLYGLACKELCQKSGAMHLWDERAMRKSFVDSVIFLPRIFTYKPFLKVFERNLKTKTRMVWNELQEVL